ncbi:hypothetical protein M8818_003577 [Zalaria obscura]|uniref:Uncharacterized protein n=1 Tax=Zalaria obscura TaxID=2024903 RepID=A0ACC3SI44_9PEZI
MLNTRKRRYLRHISIGKAHLYFITYALNSPVFNTPIMSHIPHLEKTATSQQLIVHDEPFLMLAAELQNSSLTSTEYMRTKWQDLVDTNINTVLGCVTWEMIEPTEGQFDFSLLDQIIRDARAYGLKLVLLWFGSFKNGMSTYVPEWVKIDQKRFPRARLRKAGSVLETADVLSIFHEEAPKADAKAFATLMRHLREIDEAYSTVIMVQVENECGLLGDSRDGSKAAEKAFHEPVPDELSRLLLVDWNNLHPMLKANIKLESLGIAKYADSWDELFGRGKRTDELFMAYHYSLYVERVAAAGKSEYPLPLYTNVWMNSAESESASATEAGGGGTPGEYPSGGAVSNVLDVWQHFAPSLDFISPDIYLNNYWNACADYRHRDQPLFIPEQRRDEYGARRIWVAYGSFQALGASPFGIDTLDPKTSAFRKHYGMLASISPVVLEVQRRPGTSIGFFFDELRPDGSDPSPPIVHEIDGFELRIERSFVFGKPGPGCGMVLKLQGNRDRCKFLLVGWGFQVGFRSLKKNTSFTGILSMKEVTFDKKTGEFQTHRVLNGDETRSGKWAMMPNEDPDYAGFPIAITIPAGTGLAECEVYSLDEQIDD